MWIGGFCLLFSFSFFEPLLHHYSSEEIDQHIEKCEEKLAQQSLHWKEKCALIRLENLDFFLPFEDTFCTGTLTLVEEGRGSAYLLKDLAGTARYLIKPCDEALFCLNNRKGKGSPFLQIRSRPDHPLYASAQIEALSYQVAKEIGLENVTPPTHLALLSHPNFFQNGLREKLCSIQEYYPDLCSLEHFCPSHAVTFNNFESILLFSLLILDIDTHAGNVFVKENGLLKIDNGFAFPERNRGVINVLLQLPQASQPISDEGAEWLQQLPTTSILSWIHFFELETSKRAFLQRVDRLKQSTQIGRPSLSTLGRLIVLPDREVVQPADL